MTNCGILWDVPIDFVVLSPQKPPLGSDCNGCGFCCQNEPCEAAEEYLGIRKGSSPATCPALEFNGSQYRCGLIERPSHYVKAGHRARWKDELLSGMIARLIGVGQGCYAGPAGMWVQGNFSVERFERIKATLTLDKRTHL